MLPTAKTTTDLFPNVFRDFFNTDILAAPVSGISVNLSETEDVHVIEAAVPGVPKDAIDINVEKNVLSIEHNDESNNEETTDNYVRREFRKSSFKRSFTLPRNADADNITASADNGVLVITIPKLDKNKYVKSIKVR